MFYQAWAFVAPGLYAHEKRLVLPLVISSSLLFIAGVAFCYFFVFGRVFHFIGDFAPTSIAVMPDIENYLDFVMSMCLAFGATFEVPVVVVILVRMGIVSVDKLKSIRPYAIVGAFVIAAIVTPPDAVSQLSLAMPMCLLFELGLLLAPMFVRVTPGAGRGDAVHRPLTCTLHQGDCTAGPVPACALRSLRTIPNHVIPRRRLRQSRRIKGVVQPHVLVRAVGQRVAAAVVRAPGLHVGVVAGVGGGAA